jgi:hypothetical protein
VVEPRRPQHQSSTGGTAQARAGARRERERETDSDGCNEKTRTCSFARSRAYELTLCLLFHATACADQLSTTRMMPSVAPSPAPPETEAVFSLMRLCNSRPSSPTTRHPPAAAISTPTSARKRHLGASPTDDELGKRDERQQADQPAPEHPPQNKTRRMSVQSDGPGVESRRLSTASAGSDSTTSDYSPRSDRSSSDSYASSAYVLDTPVSTAPVSRRASLDSLPARAHPILQAASRSLPMTPPAPLRRIVRPKMDTRGRAYHSANLTLPSAEIESATAVTARAPAAAATTAFTSTVTAAAQALPSTAAPQVQKTALPPSAAASRSLASLPAALRARYSSSIACRHAVLAHSIWTCKTKERNKRAIGGMEATDTEVNVDPLDPSMRLKERLEKAARMNAPSTPVAVASLPPAAASAAVQVPSEASMLTKIVSPPWTRVAPVPQQQQQLQQQQQQQQQQPPLPVQQPPLPPHTIHLSLPQIHQQLLQLAPADQFRLLQQLQASTAAAVQPTAAYANLPQTSYLPQPHPMMFMPSSTASNSLPPSSLARQPLHHSTADASQRGPLAAVLPNSNTTSAVSNTFASPSLQQQHQQLQQQQQALRGAIPPSSMFPSGFPSSIQLSFHRPSTAAASANLQPRNTHAVQAIVPPVRLQPPVASTPIVMQR